LLRMEPRRVEQQQQQLLHGSPKHTPAPALH
jgi:hypothetical protein